MILSLLRSFRNKATALGGLALAVAVISCDQTAQETTTQNSNDPKQALIARGRTVYQTVCIACHNTDPKKPGSLGPEVWGASPALLQARITSATYPPGYTPKRTTHVMQPLPQVSKDIPALEAYLGAMP